MSRLATFANTAARSFIGNLPSVITFTKVIDSDMTSYYNLKNDLIAANIGYVYGQSQKLIANITINSGVTIANSTTVSAYAFEVSSIGCGPGSQLNLTVNGRIQGYGGRGGRGTSITAMSMSGGLITWSYSVTSGQNGGAALGIFEPNLNTYISGTGYIAGGGGGGAGGGPGISGDISGAWSAGGSGGGGGRGSSGYSVGGTGGSALMARNNGASNLDAAGAAANGMSWWSIAGNNGSAGTLTAAGSGGSSVNSRGAVGGAGGAGGDAGSAGSAGSPGQNGSTVGGAYNATYSNPGAAGRGISTNGNTSNLHYSGSFPTNIIGVIT